MMLTRTLACVLGIMTTAHVLAAPPAVRMQRLATGVNIPHWFWCTEDTSSEFTRQYLGDKEIDALKAAGFAHVRLPVEPDFLWNSGSHTIRSDALEDYKAAIGRFTCRGMAVVVDPHPMTTPWIKAGSDAFADEYELFWGGLAKALSATDPELVILEIMNEPHDYVQELTWPAMQERFAERIRMEAPRHTLIATGDQWGGIQGLTRLRPLQDPNVAYSFHFYEPMTFTHQSAGWGSPNWADLRDVPYPPTPERLRDSETASKSDKARGEVRWYGSQGWCREKVEGQIDRAAKWGQDHNVALYCGEFGAIRSACRAEDRATWTRDVAMALRDRKIGWAMWDYDGSFSMCVHEGEDRVPDGSLMNALGLGNGAGLPKEAR